MTTSSVPFTDVPARPWLSADARRWRHLQVPVWARPVGPAVLVAVAVFWAVIVSPDPSCTPAAPCGAQWVDGIATTWFLPHVLCLFFLPELALISGPLLLLYMAGPGTWAGGPEEKAADCFVVAALCWGLVSGVTRLRVRRRQDALIRDAAGGLAVAAPAPAGVRPARRGVIRWVAGALLCAAGAAVVATVVADNRADDRTARTATARDVPVVKYNAGDYALTVRLPDGTRHRFAVVGDYRGQHRVRVLVHGDWTRLAGEPYGDRSGRQLLAVVLAGVGVTLIASGLLARHRVTALLSAPVPVLRVLTRRNGGNTEIYAADDTAGLDPVLHYRPHIGARETLRQALLYGPVRGDRELVLASATESGQWLVEVSVSPIRPGAAPDLPQADGVPVSGGPAKDRAAAEDRVREARAALATGPARVRWQPGPVAFVTALVLFAVVAAGPVALYLWGVHPSPLTFWYLMWLCWVVPLARIARWRIVAAPDGLYVRTLWRTHHRPWDDATAVVYNARGELGLACREGVDDIRIGMVGSPRLERWSGRPSCASRAAAEVTALIREPGLRPALPVS
ncbi:MULTISPECIES: hypothetical protein [unclassified Streptomyces]|uniref:hypothetical protein n=1 Tax=unclassified Streptomyces TaxID=2593676 RepID=UPI002E2D8039|nr:hypothetical protein [Streptomyces sp. NBC_00223]